VSLKILVELWPNFFAFSLVFPKIHPKFFGLIPFAKETNFGSTLYKMAQPTKST